MTGIISTSHYIAGLPVSIKFTCNHLVGVIKLALQSCDRHFINHAPLSFLLPITHPLGRTFFLSPVFHCMKNSRWGLNILRCERSLEEISPALQAMKSAVRKRNEKWQKTLLSVLPLTPDFPLALPMSFLGELFNYEKKIIKFVFYLLGCHRQRM